MNSLKSGILQTLKPRQTKKLNKNQKKGWGGVGENDLQKNDIGENYAPPPSLPLQFALI